MQRELRGRELTMLKDKGATYYLRKELEGINFLNGS